MTKVRAQEWNTRHIVHAFRHLMRILYVRDVDEAPCMVSEMGEK